MLDDNTNAQIYSLLKKNFPINTYIPMNRLAVLLKKNGFDYKNLGFSKMKTMISQIPFLQFDNSKNDNKQTAYFRNWIQNSKEKNQKNKHQSSQKSKSQSPSIIIDGKVVFLEKNNPVLKKDKVPKPKESPKKETGKRKNQAIKLTEQTLTIPEKIIQSIQLLTISDYKEETLKHVVCNDFKKAFSNNQITKRKDTFVFPSSLRKYTGQILYIGIKNSTNKLDCYYINYIGTSIDKPGDVFSNQVKFDDFDKAIEQLAKLATPEQWCFNNSKDPLFILKIYLQYVFYRIQKQNRLIQNKENTFAIFNTGLINNTFDDIYCLLKIKNSEFIFVGFTTAGNDFLGKTIIELFPKLPNPPTFIDDFTTLEMDANPTIHIDYNHILIDNISRFPLNFLSTLFSSFKDLQQTIHSIIKCKNQAKSDNLYGKLKASLLKNPLAFQVFKSYFDGVVKDAIKLASHDYRYILPSFFSTKDSLCLMLPLILDQRKGPQLVLLLDKVTSGNYQGQTILTLKQCYVNSRIIGPIKYTFLNNLVIED